MASFKDTTTYTWFDTGSYVWGPITGATIVTALPGVIVAQGFGDIIEPTYLIAAVPGTITASGFGDFSINEPTVTALPGVIIAQGSAGVDLFRFTAPPGQIVASGFATEPRLVDLADSQLCYYFTLTGSPDIEIPISSFQARMRSGTPTYLSVVVPGLSYAGEVADRSTGDMKVDAVFYVGETQVRQTIIWAHLDDIRIDDGALSKSLTLTGHRQETYEQKSLNMSGHTYRSVVDGRILYRFAKPDLIVRPGDVVTAGDDTFEVDIINYYVSSETGTQMEISEE